ncbi:hypothetical protein ACFX1Z_019401 [Malus domestica]
MMSRVTQGIADFEETFFLRCHVYYSSGHGKQTKFEPRPFWVYLFAVDTEKLDFGKSNVDLSHMILESIKKSHEGKAKCGELVLKLGFQIMENDEGVGIYSQAEDLKSAQKEKEPEAPKVEELDLPDFEVMDKGVEFQDKEEEYGEEQSETSIGKKSTASSEVVKEIVHEKVHTTRLTELDSIAQQIKALESLMGKEKNDEKDEDEEDIKSQNLKADEENVIKEFLQMLEEEEILNEYKLNRSEIPPLKLEGTEESGECEAAEVFLPDLRKSLGCVVQTRDGGYLATMNLFDTLVARKDTPKLSMQISKPFVLPWDKVGKKMHFGAFWSKMELGMHVKYLEPSFGRN